ncbi:MAG: PEP-CTERM sorting domain-containing protein [Acidobacteria bacterium]|nr:PEP-CTERM sorting domain-containing protein [Acidobacteriota bacterium]
MNKVTRFLLVAAVLWASDARAASFVFSDFSDVSQLQLNGDAQQAGSVLRLTPSLPSQSGTAFYETVIALSADYSFSTFFSFQITAPGGIGDGDGQGADGITFIVQTNSNTAGSAGGGIGYQDIPNSVAVEYDTYNNGLGVNDPDGNHIGVDLGGSIASAIVAPVVPRLNGGDIFYSWIDYNGATNALEVRLSTTAARPVAPFLAYIVDLEAQLGVPNAYVGFGSGTGSGFGNHDILAWEFRDEFDPIDPSVPEPATLSLLGLGSLAMAGLRRRRRQ